MKILIALLMTLTGVLTAWSQSDNLDSLLLEVLGNDKEILRFINPPTSFCYLYGGVGSDSKTYYAGREIGDNMYNMSGNIFFFHSKGFFTGVSGIWYSETDPGYSNTILTVGLSKSINQKKTLFLRASYSRYFYHNSDTIHTLKNNLAAGITLRNKWIGSRLSFNFLFGSDFGINIRPDVFSRIPVLHFGKFNKIQLEPELSVLFGSETVEYVATGNLVNSQASQTPSTTEDVFGLLNTQIALPVCFYLGDFDIEVSYSVNIPVSSDESVQYPVSSYVSLSIGYLLPLN
jgi:hypothetical protein